MTRTRKITAGHYEVTGRDGVAYDIVFHKGQGGYPDAWMVGPSDHRYHTGAFTDAFPTKRAAVEALTVPRGCACTAEHIYNHAASGYCEGIAH